MVISNLERLLLNIGIALSSEKNSDKLLETLMKAAMSITNCDGGTLYVLEDDALHFKIMISKSGEICIGADGEKVDQPPTPLSRRHVSACAAIDKTVINIADINDSKYFGFTGPKEFDVRNDYNIVSILTVPMENDSGDVIGVFQLVNALDSDGKIIPFAPEYEQVILSLASQAAICLTSRQHAEAVSELLDSFVRVMSAAIDARSPYNANHTRNMAKYADKFADWLIDCGLVDFTEPRKRQFLMSVWLHDIGKLVVPLEIMDKKNRLGAKKTTVMHRFQVIGLQNEINFLKGAIGIGERDRCVAELAAARELIERVDKAGTLSGETLEAIRALGEKKVRSPEGETPFLTDDELDCLLVQKGTLTDNERRIMESHVTMTRLMLSEMCFPKHYRLIPCWASLHHEYLNGDGYPDKLTQETIPLEARALTIMDIFEAITAGDRPYKPAIPAEKAFAMLDDMAAARQIDAFVLELFKRSEAWKE